MQLQSTERKIGEKSAVVNVCMCVCLSQVTEGETVCYMLCSCVCVNVCVCARVCQTVSVCVQSFDVLHHKTFNPRFYNFFVLQASYLQYNSLSVCTFILSIHSIPLFICASSIFCLKLQSVYVGQLPCLSCYQGIF